MERQSSSEFPPGSYGMTVNGQVAPADPIQGYLLNVSAGQTIIVTFTGAGAMRGSISGQGTGGGPYYGSGDSFAVPTNGMYTIYVGANTMAGEPWEGGFTLAVLVANA